MLIGPWFSLRMVPTGRTTVWKQESFLLWVPLSQFNSLTQWIFSSVSHCIRKFAGPWTDKVPWFDKDKQQPLPSKGITMSREAETFSMRNWYLHEAMSVFSVMFWAGGDWPVSKRERSLRSKDFAAGNYGEDRDKYKENKEVNNRVC